MSDLSLDVLREVEPDGWRLWHLHQHTKGHWECRMYSVKVKASGEGSGFLSPDGAGATPRAAILAAVGRAAEHPALAEVRTATLDRLTALLTTLADQAESGRK